MSLAVIVPSRGRPENCHRLAEAFTATTAGPTDLYVVFDPDDPRRADYEAADFPWLMLEDRMRLGPTLNHVAEGLAHAYDAIGFLGDDHLPRTVGWDARILAELDRLSTGLAYGNDLLQGERLPTAVFMTADIIRALGWMCPPGLTHLYLDDSWLALGRALGAISYLPDVIIEHLHPIAGKAAPDAGYAEANTPDLWAHDEAVYRQWLTHGLAGDVDKIRAAVPCG